MTLLLLVLFIIVLPFAAVMYAARAVGAGRTGFGSVIVALLMQTALSKIIDASTSSALLAFLASILGGAFLFQLVLDTTFKKGLIIGIVGSVIMAAGVFLVLPLFGVSLHVKTG